MTKRFGVAGLLAAALMLGGLAACNKKSTGPDPDPDPVYDTSWTYSRTVTLAALDTAATDTLTNYPLLVRLAGGADSTGGDALAGAGTGGASLRFYTEDGATALPHEIEYWSPLEAAIWVRVPSVTLNAVTTLKMYWGDSVPAAAMGAVFDTAAGFEAVFHLAEGTGDTTRDATQNGFKGVPIGSASVDTATLDTVVLHPLDVTPVGGALIGRAKNFRGDSADIGQGSAFRLVTAEGENTNASFDYAGTDAVFTVSAWVRVNAMPANNNLRRGIVTKAAVGLGTTNTSLQWHLRTINDNSGSFSFLRTSVAPGPFAVARPDAVGEWTLVSYSTAAAGASLRVYNNLGATGTATPATQNGTHQDVDVFLGAFAGTGGLGSQFWNGLIDEVRISKVARSNGWHDLDFATQRPGADAVSLGATATEEHVIQVE